MSGHGEHESHAGIVAEIRARAGAWMDDKLKQYDERLADRLDAAHRREVATTKESLAVGNSGDCAKLREALELCAKGMCGFCIMDAEARGMSTECVNGCEALRKAKAALAAPPRNCDVGTAEEQSERYKRFCTSYKMYHGNCFGCPSLCIQGLCELAWAQLPYEIEVQS